MSIEKIILKSAQKIGENLLTNIGENTQSQHNDICGNKLSSQKIPQENSDFKFAVDDKIIKNKDEIAIINARGRNTRLNIMVIGAAIGLCLCLALLTIYTGKLSGEIIGIVSTVAGIFGACLKDAYSFEFGSSRGSRDKDERISATILEKLKK